MATTGPLSEPTILVSPQAAGPAVPEREIGPGGVSGCSAMPGSEKVQPARQSSRIQGGQDTLERHAVKGEGEGSGGGDGGARGELSPVGGSKGPEPLASPNVLHWVGWLPGTTRCGAGPAVPASHGAAARRARGVQVEGRLAETELRSRPSALHCRGRPFRFPHRRRDLRSLRGESVQAAFWGVLVCQGVRKSSLPGKARGFRGHDTVERHDGLSVVMEKIDQWEQENPASNGRQMIDDFRRWG